MSSTKSRELFGEPELLRIREAIAAAEKRTSGELRVFIEDDCKDDVMDRAAFVFEELDMHETELRNGVLIYVAVSHRKLAIIGDAGIHQKVGDRFWESIRSNMINRFKSGAFMQGVEEGIHAIGEPLSTYFPHDHDGDRDELSNDVVFGK